MPHSLFSRHPTFPAHHIHRSHSFGSVSRVVVLALLTSYATLSTCSALGSRLNTLQRGYEPTNAPGGALQRLRVALDSQHRQSENVAPPCAATVLAENDWSSLQTRITSEMLGYQVRLGQLKGNPKPLSCPMDGIGRQLPRKKIGHVVSPSNDRALKTPSKVHRLQPNAFEPGAARDDSCLPDVQLLEGAFVTDCQQRHSPPETWILHTEVLDEMEASLSKGKHASPSLSRVSLPGAPQLASLAAGLASSAGKAAVSVGAGVQKLREAAMQPKNLFVQELLRSSVTVAAAYAPGLGVPRGAALCLSLWRTLQARHEQRGGQATEGEEKEARGGGLRHALSIACEAAAWSLLDGGRWRRREVVPTRDPAALLGLAQRSFGQNVCRRVVEEAAGRLRVGAAVLNSALLGASLLGCKVVGGRYTTDGRDVHINGCFCQGLDDPDGFWNPHRGLFGQREELCGLHTLLDIPFCAIDIVLGSQGIPSMTARYAIADPLVRSIAGDGGLLEGHSLGTMDVKLVKEKVGWVGDMVLYAPPPTVGWESGVRSVCMDRDPICGGPLAKLFSIGTTVVRVQRSVGLLLHDRETYRGEVAEGAANDDQDGLAELARIISGTRHARESAPRLEGLFSLPLGALSSVSRPLILAWVGPRGQV